MLHNNNTALFTLTLHAYSRSLISHVEREDYHRRIGNTFRLAVGIEQWARYWASCACSQESIFAISWNRTSVACMGFSFDTPHTPPPIPLPKESAKTKGEGGERAEGMGRWRDGGGGRVTRRTNGALVLVRDPSERTKRRLVLAEEMRRGCRRVDESALFKLAWPLLPWGG